MSGIQRTVMAILTAVFLRSILKQILQDQKMKDWMHLLGGIYITVVIACGIRQLDYSAVTDQIHSSWEEADFYSMEGKHQADAVLHQRIKDSCEAYVLNIAGQMNAAIKVDITLSDQEIPVPEKIVVYGEVSSDIKTRLSEILTQDLGINRGDQIWIG